MILVYVYKHILWDISVYISDSDFANLLYVITKHRALALLSIANLLNGTQA